MRTHNHQIRLRFLDRLENLFINDADFHDMLHLSTYRKRLFDQAMQGVMCGMISGTVIARALAFHRSQTTRNP